MHTTTPVRIYIHYFSDDNCIITVEIMRTLKVLYITAVDNIVSVFHELKSILSTCENTQLSHNEFNVMMIIQYIFFCARNDHL